MVGECTDRAKEIRALLEDITSWNPFCHGTSERFVPDIKEKGLRPRECDGDVCRPSVYEGKDISRPDRVYVARVRPALGTCLFSAQKAQEKFNRQSDAVVFGIEFDRRDEPALTSDEDADFFIGNGDAGRRCKETLVMAHELSRKAFRHSAYSDFLPSVVTDKILDFVTDEPFTEDEQDCICGNQPAWLASLITRWTVAHKGPLPPERLCGPEPVRNLYYGVPEEPDALRRIGVPL